MRARAAAALTLATVAAGAAAISQEHPATRSGNVVVIGRRAGPPCPEARQAPAPAWSRICAAAKLSRAAKAAADQRDAAAARAVPDATPGDVRVGIASVTASGQRIGRDLRRATSLSRPVTPLPPRAALPRRMMP